MLSISKMPTSIVITPIKKTYVFPRCWTLRGVAAISIATARGMSWGVGPRGASGWAICAVLPPVDPSAPIHTGRAQWAQQFRGRHASSIFPFSCISSWGATTPTPTPTPPLPATWSTIQHSLFCKFANLLPLCHHQADTNPLFYSR